MKKRKGQAIVEFIGVLFFFIMFVMLIIDLSRIALSMQVAYSAAYEGARTAALTSKSADPLKTGSERADSVIKESMPFIKKTQCTVTPVAPRGIDIGQPVSVQVDCKLQSIWTGTAIPSFFSKVATFSISRKYTTRLEDV